MPKDSIKDNLDGNELDLSLNNLSVVPVKELSAIPKATHLDLSCNVLTSLPDGFCNLTHLVKIDLSKNHLASLPTKFGSLVNLQHLDLLGNQLEKLPFSFCHLQRLKWLDLKDNPLDTGLKGAAGDCLDEAQCRKCAKNVLLYMKQVAADAERRKQKQLLEAREREAAAKRKEEEERLKKKAEKKAEKERRKQQHQAKRDLEVKEQVEDIAKDSDEAEICNGPSRKSEHVQSSKSCFGGCCFWLFTLLALLLAVVLGAHFHCTSSKPHELCKTHYEPVRHLTVAKYHETRNIVEDFIEKQFGQKADSKSSSKKNTKKGNVKQ